MIVLYMRIEIDRFSPDDLAIGEMSRSFSEHGISRVFLLIPIDLFDLIVQQHVVRGHVVVVVESIQFGIVDRFEQVIVRIVVYPFHGCCPVSVVSTDIQNRVRYVSFRFENVKLVEHYSTVLCLIFILLNEGHCFPFFFFSARAFEKSPEKDKGLFIRKNHSMFFFY